MGVTAAVGILAVSAINTAHNQNEQMRAAKDAARAQEEDTNKALNDQAQQKNNAQNQSANTTAAAQARVRGIANGSPDGSTIMTPAPSGGAAAPAAASLAPTTGKSTLGS